MKTALAADEPERPTPVLVHFGPSTTSFAGTAAPGSTTLFIYLGQPPHAAPPRGPYRTTAYVGTPVPEIEGVSDVRT